MGSLKGSELYRIVLDENDRYVHSEVLLKQLARIRDIETGPDGNIYLLLEHADGADRLCVWFRLTGDSGWVGQEIIQIGCARLLPPFPVGTGASSATPCPVHFCTSCPHVGSPRRAIDCERQSARCNHDRYSL